MTYDSYTMTTAASTDTSNSTPDANAWHIVQQTEGHCEILTQADLNQATTSPKTWGPFTSRSEAIAKRVGLIRAGKCLPK